MTDEVLENRDQPDRETNEPSQQVTAGPTQLLTGLEVGLPTNRVVCVSCGAQLIEGRAVTVYAYRTTEAVDWDLRQCYCTDCAPAGIETPTLGVAELLAQAWLGTVALPRTRTHRLCLTEVDLVAASPLSEGHRP